MMGEETRKVVDKMPKILKRIRKKLKDIKYEEWNKTEKLEECLEDLEIINDQLNKAEILDNLN